GRERSSSASRTVARGPVASARMAGAAVWVNSSGVVLIWLTANLSGGALHAENGRREKLLQAMCPFASALRLREAKSGGRTRACPPSAGVNARGRGIFGKNSDERLPESSAESRTKTRD